MEEGEKVARRLQWEARLLPLPPPLPCQSSSHLLSLDGQQGRNSTIYLSNYFHQAVHQSISLYVPICGVCWLPREPLVLFPPPSGPRKAR